MWIRPKDTLELRLLQHEIHRGIGTITGWDQRWSSPITDRSTSLIWPMNSGLWPKGRDLKYQASSFHGAAEPALIDEIGWGALSAGEELRVAPSRWEEPAEAGRGPREDWGSLLRLLTPLMDGWTDRPQLPAHKLSRIYLQNHSWIYTTHLYCPPPHFHSPHQDRWSLARMMTALLVIIPIYPLPAFVQSVALEAWADSETGTVKKAINHSR